MGSQVVQLCQEHSLSYVALDSRVANNDNNLLSSVSTVIDCGFPRDYYNRNVAENYLIEINKRVERFASLGKNYLYISTYSGIATRESQYSRLKADAENILSKIDATCFRIGLVTSQNNPGGRYLELKRLAEGLPFLIIPSSGWFPVLTYKIENFNYDIRSFLMNNYILGPVTCELKSLDRLFSEMNLQVKTIRLPGLLSGLFAILCRFLPLNKLEGLKAIAVSESFAISGLAKYNEVVLRNHKI